MKRRMRMHLCLSGYLLLSTACATAKCTWPLGTKTVPVTNVTNNYLFAVIVPTELSIRNRHTTLYIADPAYQQVEAYAEHLCVWAIPPGKTANIALPPWDALHYDRNLWVTRTIGDLGAAMKFGRKSIAAQTPMAFYNVGSSTTPRFVSGWQNDQGKETKQLRIFTKQEDALKYANDTTIDGLHKLTDKAVESDLLLLMRQRPGSYQISLRARVGRMIVGALR